MPSLLSPEAGAARRSPFEARHRIAKLAALQRLHQKIVGARTQGRDHRFPVGMEVRDDHVKIGRGLLHFLERLQPGLRIARQIQDHRRVRTALQVLQHANVEILCGSPGIRRPLYRSPCSPDSREPSHENAHRRWRLIKLTTFDRSSHGKQTPCSGSHPLLSMGSDCWKFGITTGGSPKKFWNLAN